MATYFLDIENADKPLKIERLHVGDNGIRTLNFRFVKGGKHFDLPKDCTATLYALLPDGSKIFDPCTVKEDTVIYTVTGGTECPTLTSIAGEAQCEIRLTFPDGKALTSPSFSIFCDTIMQNDENIEATESFSALTDAIARVEAIEKNYTPAYETFIFDDTHAMDATNLEKFGSAFESYKSDKDFYAFIRYSNDGEIRAPADVYLDYEMDYCIISTLGSDMSTAYLIIYAAGELDYRKESLSFPSDGGGGGENGATFTPAISEDGTLSWTNDKGLEDPEPVNIVEMVLAALPSAEEVAL